MKNYALFRLHFIVFLWGFTAILGKLVHVGAPQLVFYRMLFATLFLFLYAVLIRKESLKVSRNLMFQLIGVGSLVALHWFCFFQSIKISNVSVALSCLSLSTLFAAVLEPLIFRRRADWAEIIFGLVIVGCISMIFNAEIKYKEGIIIGMLCALLGSLFSVLNGKMYGKTSSGNVIFYEMFGGWAVISLLFLVTGNLAGVGEITSRDLALILLLAGLFTAYPMLESVKLMKYFSPFTLILTVNLEPVYGILLAYFIFGESEKMSPVFYICALVMISAIFANGILKARRRAKALV